MSKLVLEYKALLLAKKARSEEDIKENNDVKQLQQEKLDKFVRSGQCVDVLSDVKPNLARMDRLEDGQFIASWISYSDCILLHIYVRCSKVDKVNVRFACPFCWLRINKDGTPRKNSKRREHIHGTGGRVTVGYHGHRVSHCSTEVDNFKFNGFELVVTESTEGSEPVDYSRYF